MGVTVGLAGAAFAARLLQGLLYGVAPFDAASFAAAVACFLAVALVAGALPARRVMRVDPMTTLRAD